MSLKTVPALIVVLATLATATGCGNTIRGVGRDVGNAVDATQDAGRSVASSIN
ncbi:hypothetical protein M8R20_20820 [Pseudomonas sp. R2.Fl]|nr:hypothetical protein [Pseudomonas sp. R2.Fl]